MKMQRPKFDKNLWIQLVITVFCGLALIACGSSDRPKNVHRNSKYGRSNLEKPTPQSGVNAAAYLALTTIATKQLERALDLAIQQSASKYIHECQKASFTVKPIDNTTEEMTLQTLPAKCPTGRARNSEIWSGEEIFIVKYEDSGRGTSAKISSITLKPSREVTTVARSFNDGTAYSQQLINEQLSITKTATAAVYEFGYSVNAIHTKTGQRATGRSLEAKAARNRSGPTNLRNADSNLVDDDTNNEIDNAPVDNGRDLVAPDVRDGNVVKSISNIDMIGTVNISNLNRITWTITEGQTRYKRVRNTKEEIDTTLILKPSQNTADRVLVCGRPVGQFPTTQTVVGAPHLRLSPTITINEDGVVVSAANTRRNFQTKSCKAEPPVLAGFTDLSLTLFEAESIANIRVDLTPETQATQPPREPRNLEAEQGDDDLEINAEFNQ